MLIDNKLTERGETNTFADLVKVFLCRGPNVKLIISSSYKFCFIATVYCGCISFCPQCALHQANK